MRYTVDIICNNAWVQYSTEMPDNTPTVKKKLVNNSQKLVKDLVKETNMRGEEE